jgi:hypothetical protein
MIAYIRSLFTDKPQHYKDSWYFVRGKKRSAKELLLEQLMKEVEKIKKRVTEGPNIKL